MLLTKPTRDHEGHNPHSFLLLLDGNLLLLSHATVKVTVWALFNVIM